MTKRDEYSPGDAFGGEVQITTVGTPTPMVSGTRVTRADPPRARS